MTQLQNKPKKWLNTNQSSNRRLVLIGLGGAAVVLAASLIFILWPRQGETNPPVATANPDQSGAPTETMTRTSEGGQVTVKVTWQKASAAPELVFEVALDTHSVDLDSYDLAQMALLRTGQGQGQQPVRPVKWDAPKGGHHREGKLTFSATSPDGRPLLGPDIRSFELVLQGVGGLPERVLSWKV